jgi:DNA-binding IclR family transcriptional regulator
VGEVFPLTTTANGQASLSLVPPDKAAELAQDEWDRRGVTADLDRFMAKLDMIRSTGLAYDLDSHTVGISAIGFAFKGHSDDIHAISVPVPTTRFEEVRETIETALQKTAGHVAKLMLQS